MDELYDYLFHYNNSTGLWYAFKREDYVAHFNGKPTSSEVLKNKNINVIIDYLYKTNSLKKTEDNKHEKL